MKHRSIFVQALSLMRGEFSSTEFIREARKFGLPNAATKSGLASEFLHLYCTQTGGFKSRTWVKNGERTESANIFTPNDQQAAHKKEYDAFEFGEICNQFGAPFTREFFAAMKEFFVGA